MDRNHAHDIEAESVTDGTTANNPNDALRRLNLPKDKRVLDLSSDEMARFRQLIGWEPGAPIVDYPQSEEQLARANRERWKLERAGKGKTEPCLWIDASQVETFKRNLLDDPETAAWWQQVIRNADEVADLRTSVLSELIPDVGPWTFAGSFCPNCVGEKSPTSIHAPFWRWDIHDPDRLTCPYCATVYPNDMYPEDGTLSLPRLGLTYTFHISGREHTSADWRDGRSASNFAEMPTHVSFTGEIRTIKLAWCLGQVEPMSVAYAVTGDDQYARAVTTILGKLADVYHRYPVFSYAQEYVDTDPAYAALNIDEMPTVFRRAASLATYTGDYGTRGATRGMDQTTTSTSYYTNAEWGTSRLGREKASNGQLFISLFKGYDLIKTTLSDAERTRIERDFLLELYLDTRDLSQRINNKSGPGAASRVAVGVFYDDQEAIDEGVDQFRQINDGQFYPDGTWKETPIYGAKSIYEGLHEIPEMLRGQMDLYSDSLYRRAFETYSELATPLQTQPALGDSPVDYKLQPILVDIARIRMNLPLSYGPSTMDGFGVRSAQDIGANSGYTPSLTAIVSESTRDGLDGGCGFGCVGHIPRPVSTPSWFSLFNEPRQDIRWPTRGAINRHFSSRQLICLGFGKGETGTQLYADGGDGRHRHRHHAPLSLLLFSAGREIFPDLGYIGDHPANNWIKTTASHNTVLIDGESALPASKTEILGFSSEGEHRFVDIMTECPSPEGGTHVRRRALLLMQKSDGHALLIDLFDTTGGHTHDYIVRVNDPTFRFESIAREGAPRTSPFSGHFEPGPFDFRSLGAVDRVDCAWGDTDPVRVHILSQTDELITFKSPAWRNRTEVFEQPDRAWDAVILRTESDTTRHLVAYNIGGDPVISDTVDIDRDGEAEIVLHMPDPRRVTIGRGTFSVT